MLYLVLAVVWMFQAGLQAVTAKATPPVEMNSWEADRHRIGDAWHYIRVDSAKAAEIYDGVEVEAIVDPAGSVISATGGLPPNTKLPRRLVAQAERLVRALQYKPFMRHGRAVTAKVTEYVQILPPELKPARHLAFPHVKDWKSVKITLQRTECLTECPAYRVEVHGDGTVVYQGGSSVAFIGQHRGLVPRENVIELVRQFELVDYYSLRDEYRGGVADQVTRMTSIEIDGQRKQVTDYAGVETGMPVAVSDLEDTIDRLAGSERWTRGNAETLAALQAEHWDFKSDEAADTLAFVARYGNADAVRDLVFAGTPTNGSNTSQKTALAQAADRGDLAMLRAVLDAGAATNPDNLADAVAAAAGSGKVEAIAVLLSAGGNIKSRDQMGRTVLETAAMSGSPAMVEEVLKSHPDLNAIDGEGYTALMQVAIYDFYQVTREDVQDVVHLLLQAGADPNVRDQQGDTALILCATFNKDLVLPLVQAGADVNARNNQGQSAFDNAEDPDIKRILMQHGAVRR